MIQRKQSVYLFLVAIIMSWLLVRPYAEIVLVDGRSLIFHSLVIKSYSIPNIIENFKYTIPLALLVFLTGALNFVNIFLFNRRIIQMRLCLLSLSMLILIILTMTIYYFMIRSSMDFKLHFLRMAAGFPILGIVFNFLAYKSIQQDEMLVKSYDRIR